MKNLCLFLLFCSLLSALSCKNGGQSKSGLGKADFIDSFKTNSFCRCVELGNNKQLKLSEGDVSCRPPDWLYAEGDVIDSLVLAEVQKIKRDSLNRAQYSVAEGMEGKLVISHCLAFYKSKALEAVARKRANSSPY
ncbi:hypothetical protein [Nibribacter koreensis]|uniref:Lipoprotein n=1 Tax=Nibribacter koreensis TaxID=1084519 RepID=A0ABP8G034_9BACT